MPPDKLSYVLRSPIWVDPAENAIKRAVFQLQDNDMRDIGSPVVFVPPPALLGVLLAETLAFAGR